MLCVAFLVAAVFSLVAGQPPFRDDTNAGFNAYGYGNTAFLSDLRSHSGPGYRGSSADVQGHLAGQGYFGTRANTDARYGRR